MAVLALPTRDHLLARGHLLLDCLSDIHCNAVGTSRGDDAGGCDGALDLGLEHALEVLAVFCFEPENLRFPWTPSLPRARSHCVAGRGLGSEADGVCL